MVLANISPRPMVWKKDEIAKENTACVFLLNSHCHCPISLNCRDQHGRNFRKAAPQSPFNKTIKICKPSDWFQWPRLQEAIFRHRTQHRKVDILQRDHITLKVQRQLLLSWADWQQEWVQLHSSTGGAINDCLAIGSFAQGVCKWYVQIKI